MKLYARVGAWLFLNPSMCVQGAGLQRQHLPYASQHQPLLLEVRTHTQQLLHAASAGILLCLLQCVCFHLETSAPPLSRVDQTLSSSDQNGSVAAAKHMWSSEQASCPSPCAYGTCTLGRTGAEAGQKWLPFTASPVTRASCWIPYCPF